MATAPSSSPSMTHGRLCILLAAVLWSLSGGFAKLLTCDTFLSVNTPSVAPLTLAFYRALFAGLTLVPALRRRDVSLRWPMIATAFCFAVMNALFVSALAEGTAANAIFLQYTAPMWMYLASILWLGEPADRRGLVVLLAGLAGIAVIVVGGWESAQAVVVAIALGSGLAYAGVLIGLRVLREASPRWLTVVNHLGAALVLVPLVWSLPTPTVPQLVVLFLFGAVQMALPYWLVARGLRVVSPQEAGALTLLEPLLNPVWAYLVAGERTSPYTFVGGTFILGALAWRYVPRRQPA